jgi:hypothetical protein
MQNMPVAASDANASPVLKSDHCRQFYASMAGSAAGTAHARQGLPAAFNGEPRQRDLVTDSGVPRAVLGFFGNENGDWLGYGSYPAGVDSNITADPRSAIWRRGTSRSLTIAACRRTTSAGS